MRYRYHILFLICLLIPLMASAQFYVTGDDPGRLRWFYKDTENFRIIYPEGNDSLANVYGSKLERYRKPVSLSTGYLAGGQGKYRMPVVMHTYNTSNGSVAWAPKRMDLFTVPSAYDPEPIPWSTMLSIHEGRHVTQMQFGMTNVQKPFGWAFGEMWNILVSLVYPGIYFMEGDAVIAETTLTPSGRGRTAHFLNYYHVAFDQGDFRNWDRWLYGSQKHYTPDHYALGYMTLGGYRCIWDDPTIMKRAYDRASRKIWDLMAFETVMKEKTGKNKKKTFAEICDTMAVQWKKEADERAPYIYGEPVTKEPRLYTDYSDIIFIDDDILALKSGFLDTPKLVKIEDDGEEEFVTHFGHNTGALHWSPYFHRFYWSETITDKRWSMKADSKIYYMEDGKKHSLDTDELHFNPTPSDCGRYMAVTLYHREGESSISILDGDTGEELLHHHAPEGVQIVETAWTKGNIYATGISDNGYGIYKLGICAENGITSDWENILAPQPVMVKNFGANDDHLMFTCDRTGVDELYHFHPSDGRLIQKTSTRYGACEFSYSEDGKYLYYTSQTLKGMKIFRTPVDSLISRPADYTERHSYRIADELTRQENELAAKAGLTPDTVTEDIIDYPAKRYRKFPNMFNVHSWAPVYVSPDNIMNMSFDYIWQAASIGATGIIQSELATTVGEFGYSLHKDPYNPSKWRNSGHLKLTYSGLYPVFEASLDINDRSARQMSTTAYIDGNMVRMEIASRELGVPCISGSLTTYIPFNFSEGGWYKGFIPKLSYHFSNDMFNSNIAVMSYDREAGSVAGAPTLIGVKKGKNTFRQSILGSVRGYTMLGTPNSAVYPKWGIGAEAGATGSFESSSILSPVGYAYLYGYTPGILDSHGTKLTAMYQQKLSKEAFFGQTAVNFLPRGFSSNSALLNSLAYRSAWMSKITADYACPVYIGDIGIIGGFFYIKRLVVSPHFDYTFLPDGKGLYSYGTALTLDLNSILWLGWPVSVGITGSINGGTGSYRNLNAAREELGVNMDRWFIGPTFNVSF